MEQQELVKLIKETVKDVLAKKETSDMDLGIPIGISNRHVHLSVEAVERLFGKDHRLTKLKDLSQPGQFAAEETVTVIGEKGKLKNVRVLGPTRDMTQLEISLGDGFKTGMKPSVRLSGDIKGTPSFTLQGPRGQMKIKQGLICALRHIHMHPTDATKFNVKDREKVDVFVPGERSVTFHDTLVRVSENYRLEMHIDFDEANAANIKNGQKATLLKR